jgi:Domain of unknown function (DUF6249)
MNAETAAYFTTVLVGFAVLILLCSLALRYKRRELEHKERLAALEKGAPWPPIEQVQRTAPWSPRVYLLRGLIWFFSGIGLTLFLVAMTITLGPPLLGAAFIGLVPIGVGAAYLIFYRVEAKNLPNV